MGFFRRRNPPAAQPAPRPEPGPATGAPSRRRVDPNSYDAIAEAYERGDAEHTLEVARDLVAAVEPAAGERVLDVGSGTGVVPQAVREREPAAFVVGADLAPRMLAVGVAAGRIERPVAAAAVDLPFRDQTFDVVTANFVISHFKRLDTALFDLRRVLRVRGRLGVTSWVPAPDEFDRVWTEVAERYAPPQVLREARARVVPSTETVGNADTLRDTLYGAGFRSIRIDRRGYRMEYERDSFLANRNEIRGTRYMRELLGEALWRRFQEDVAAAYRANFAERFGDSEEVLIAVAVRGD